MKTPKLDIPTLIKLSKILPTPALLTSAEQNLNHVFLAYFQAPIAALDTYTIPLHANSVMDIDSQFRHWRQMGEEFSFYELKGGQIFFYQAPRDHKIDWRDRLNFSLLVFDLRFFEQITEGLEISGPVEFMPRLQAKDSQIQKFINALKADLEIGCPLGSVYSQAVGINLAKYLLENFSPSRPKVSEFIKGFSEVQLKQVQERIYEYISNEGKNTEKISKTDLAQIAGVNPMAFERLFYESTGMRLLKYIIRQKLEYAQQLLKDSDYSITEVASKCGYNDPNYFTRHFKKKFGIPPSEFREGKSNVLFNFEKCARRSLENLDKVWTVDK